MCGLQSHSRIQVEIQLGSLISLDLEISSFMIWGKVFLGIGAPDSSCYRGNGPGRWGRVLVRHGAGTGSTCRTAVRIADMSGATTCGWQQTAG
jgi:hypothetical protein